MLSLFLLLLCLFFILVSSTFVGLVILKVLVFLLELVWSDFSLVEVVFKLSGFEVDCKSGVFEFGVTAGVLDLVFLWLLGWFEVLSSSCEGEKLPEAATTPIRASVGSRTTCC